jgi:protein SCO1/2
MGGQLSGWPARVVVAVLAIAAAGAACRRAEPPRRYPLTGQVIAVHPDRQHLTVRHEDIAGFMPGMTMSFPVEPASLLEGRAPGELITATLEVSDATGRLVAITHAGTAPLPDNSNAATMAGGILEVGDPAPDAAFIDQHDARRPFSEWTGAPTLLTFIYTRCPLPTFCPLMDQHFATIQRAAAEDPVLRGRVRLVSISFDPEHDTPAVLARHAARLKADPAVWTFLTGDRVTIDKFAARFGVGLIRPAGAAEITHNLRTVLIGADGRIAKIYSGSDWTPSQAIADLRAAVQAP